MAHKKIVFVIVEGPSDDDALAILLQKIFEKNNVFVFVTQGDITTRGWVDSSTIVKTVTGLVQNYAKSNHLTSRHFQEIIHIVDTDGAYVPPDVVVEDQTVDDTIYLPTEIKTKNPDKIKERNRQKSGNMDRLVLERKIWGIPYQIYFMSSNLDHVLHNKQNSSDEEKEANALAFAKKYRDDIDGFVCFIAESSFSVEGSYIETWNYIRQELRSLERHTNFGICLKNINDVEEQ